MTQNLKKEKRKLCEMIQSLSQTEHDEIFKFIKSYSYTQNNNGIFINFSCIDEKDYKKIKDFVSFCYDNKESLDEYDKRLNECKSKTLTQKVLNPTSLKNIIKTNTDEDDIRIEDLLSICKNKEKIETFMSILENKTPSFYSNKSSCKYLNAKKKFAKRTVDKKNDISIVSDLFPEEPIIHRI
jgi:hypothetical protein